MLNVFQVTSLKRLDSTKRIKKELWRKRSDFLGIEGGNDDSYLEPGMCMSLMMMIMMINVTVNKSKHN
jgi:hypothetical protein